MTRQDMKTGQKPNLTFFDSYNNKHSQIVHSLRFDYSVTYTSFDSSALYYLLSAHQHPTSPGSYIIMPTLQVLLDLLIHKC